MDIRNFCVLDVETAGGMWENFPHGFDLLVTGIRVNGVTAFYSAHPSSLKAMADFLDSFDGVVVTFAGRRFDLPVLDKYFRERLGRPLKVTLHYDLLEEIQLKARRRIKLEEISYYTFGEKKVVWDFRQNRRAWVETPERFIDYNRGDLVLTEELYRRVLDRKYVFLGDTTVLLPLPEETAAPTLHLPSQP